MKSATNAQGTLFAARTTFSGRVEYAPHNGTATSKAAARAIDRNHGKPTGESMILKMLAAPRWANGATREDIEDTTGLLTQTVCPRVNGLVRLGQVQVIGTRKLRSGREGDVYQITDAGRDRVGGAA